MIRWILENIFVVAAVVIFLVQFVRGLGQARKVASERQARQSDGSEERRVREAQEQIRRRIAERRAAEAAAPEPPPLAHAPEERPVPRPTTTQLPEFGGPLGRMLEELQKKVQQHIPVPQPPVLVEHRRDIGELERQQALADELHAAQEARAVAARRAAHLATDRAAAAQSEPALRAVAREQLLRDLGDPQSLRRAFVLREVLGAPVGMR
jgi:hypothetical protein